MAYNAGRKSLVVLHGSIGDRVSEFELKSGRTICDINMRGKFTFNTPCLGKHLAYNPLNDSVFVSVSKGTESVIEEFSLRDGKETGYRLTSSEKPLCGYVARMAPRFAFHPGLTLIMWAGSYDVETGGAFRDCFNLFAFRYPTNEMVWAYTGNDAQPNIAVDASGRSDFGFVSGDIPDPPYINFRTGSKSAAPSPISNLYRYFNRVAFASGSNKCFIQRGRFINVSDGLESFFTIKTDATPSAIVFAPDLGLFLVALEKQGAIFGYNTAIF